MEEQNNTPLSLLETWYLDFFTLQAALHECCYPLFNLSYDNTAADVVSSCDTPLTPGYTPIKQHTTALKQKMQDKEAIEKRNKVVQQVKVCWDLAKKLSFFYTIKLSLVEHEATYSRSTWLMLPLSYLARALAYVQKAVEKMFSLIDKCLFYPVVKLTCLLIDHVMPITKGYSEQGGYYAQQKRIFIETQLERFRQKYTKPEAHWGAFSRLKSTMEKQLNDPAIYVGVFYQAIKAFLSKPANVSLGRILGIIVVSFPALIVCSIHQLWRINCFLLLALFSLPVMLVRLVNNIPLYFSWLFPNKSKCKERMLVTIGQKSKKHFFSMKDKEHVYLVKGYLLKNWAGKIDKNPLYKIIKKEKVRVERFCQDANKCYRIVEAWSALEEKWVKYEGRETEYKREQVLLALVGREQPCESNHFKRYVPFSAKPYKYVHGGIGPGDDTRSYGDNFFTKL